MRPDQALLDAIKAKLPELENLWEEVSAEWTYEDLVYRFYHQSFKVFGLQAITLKIVAALRALSPDCRLNGTFETILRQGTGKPAQSQVHEARPIVEAFFHARYFLEMAVRYGHELTEAPTMLPSGWAGLLYFYNLR